MVYGRDPFLDSEMGGMVAMYQVHLLSVHHNANALLLIGKRSDFSILSQSHPVGSVKDGHRTVPSFIP